VTTRIITPSKLVSETIGVTFDFTSKLVAGDSVASATTSATVYTGVDSTPSAILSGGPTITGTAQIIQKATAGVVGVIYEILCTATTTLGYVMSLSTYLAVTQDLP
jgi:hypothetical protein